MEKEKIKFIKKILKNSKKKKSQIGIFILIAIIIIILFIFLFSSKQTNKENNLKHYSTSVFSETNNKLFPLKNNVDYCLKKQLKKAIIIGGMKGGFIYDKGEYYAGQISLPNFYNINLINNLNLNWNSLTSKILIYSQTEVYPPSINKIAKNYKHSIKNDFEKFILSNFLDCIDLEKYKHEGFKISRINFSAKISKIDTPKIVELNSIIGKIKDNISVIIGDKEYFGEIFNLDLNKEKTIIKFNKNIFNKLPKNLDIHSITARNLNTSINIQIKFNNENIVAFLNFPLSISNKKFSTSYKQSKIIVTSRFKEDLNLATLLMNNKYRNRNLNYEKKKELNKIINKNFYFKNTKLKNLKISKTIILNSLEHKKYVFSIIDKDFPIFGNPFIFNFGYENTAPKINLNKIKKDNFKSKNSILFIISEGIPFQMDLKKLVEDNQYFDNFKFHFIPDSQKTSVTNYNLDQNGNLKFESLIKGRFSFNIVLTDGEAIRKQNFVFVTGFVSNLNNKDTKKCIYFENNKIGKDTFPINKDFKNKLYSFTKSSGENVFFGYTLINPKIQGLNLNPSKLKISTSCLGINPSKFKIKVTYKNLNTGLISKLSVVNKEITLPLITEPIEVKIGIYDKTSNSLVNSEPFKVEIYPSQCLGPKSFDSNLISKYGGTGTCCDLSKTPIIRTNSQKKEIKNLFKNNKIILNSGAYFTLSQEGLNYFSKAIDYSNIILWNYFGPEATSLYSGNIISKCKGIYPSFEKNIVSVSSNTPDYSSEIKSVSFDKKIFSYGKDYFTRIPFNLKLEKHANICEFGNIKNVASMNILTNDDKVWKFGLKFVNLDANIINIPNEEKYKSTQVLCDNSFYSSDYTNPNQFSDWVKGGTLGFGGSPGTVHKSKGYCHIGNSNCYGLINSNTYSKRIDISNICLDYSILNGIKFIQNKNVGWTCGSYSKKICMSENIFTGMNTCGKDKKSPCYSRSYFISHTSVNLICDGSRFSCPSPPPQNNFHCP